MPIRKLQFVTNNYYHLFNSGLDDRVTFPSPAHYLNFIEALWYYQFIKPPYKLNLYQKLKPNAKAEAANNLKSHYQRHVNIVAYLLMPNHYHLVIQPLPLGNPSRYLANTQISYTRYHNQSVGRTGPLFGRQFRAVEITNPNDLIPLSRYLHLKPLTHNIVRSLSDIEAYSYSSYSEYTFTKPDFMRFCHTQPVTNHFPNPNDYRAYCSNLGDNLQATQNLAPLLFDK